MLKEIAFQSASFLVSKGKFQQIYDEISRTQWLSREEILAYQWSKLLKLLSHAYANVPYYREVFDRVGAKPADIRTSRDFQQLPILTKSEINRHRELLKATNYRPKLLIADYTGGSTGQPLTFFRDRRFTGANYAHQVRNLSWCGVKPGDPHVYLWGSQFDTTFQKRFQNRVRSLLLNESWFDAFRLTEKEMSSIVARLRLIRPRVVSGYASALRTFARYVQHRGIELVVPGVISTAELLTEETRRLLRDVFHCEVFDRFGSREVGNSAHECGAHSGLHINAEHVLVEFVDSNGVPVEFDEQGEILYTNLDNFAFPLIRYRVGDLGVPTDLTCPCGRGLPMMKVVQGRISDMIETPNGVKIHGEFFSHLFYGWDEVQEFQVRQDEPSDIKIKLVLRNGGVLPQNLRETFIAKIHQFSGPELKVKFEVVREIPRGVSGKHHFIISTLH